MTLQFTVLVDFESLQWYKIKYVSNHFKATFQHYPSDTIDRVFAEYADKMYFEIQAGNAATF